MNYVRLFAGADGESHFEDVAVELAPLLSTPKAFPKSTSRPHGRARH
jgi:hypothetical protein